MTRLLKAWRWLAVTGAAALALGLVAGALAQAPPSVPNQFFGSASTGSGALVDAEAAADGATVTAWDQDGNSAGTAVIADGTWAISVNPDDADSVSFSIDGSSLSDSFDVTQGDLTEVALDLTTGAVEEPAVEEPTMQEPAVEEPAVEEPTMQEPTMLPNTGSGGLADAGKGSFPLLALALMAASVAVLGGATVLRRSIR